MLATPEEPKIARSEENDQFVIDTRAVERIVDPESGKTQIARQGRIEPVLSIIKHAGGVWHLFHRTILDDTDPHRPGEEEPRMEHLHLERGSQQSLVLTKADIAISIVVELRQGLWQLAASGFK